MGADPSSSSDATGIAAHAEPTPTIAPLPPRRPQAEPLDRLLDMADAYRAEHAVRQAIELYFTLVEAHDGSPQATRARERLLGMAASHQAAGERHQARAIYERLL